MEEFQLLDSVCHIQHTHLKAKKAKLLCSGDNGLVLSEYFTALAILKFYINSDLRPKLPSALQKVSKILRETAPPMENIFLINTQDQVLSPSNPIRHSTLRQISEEPDVLIQHGSQHSLELTYTSKPIPSPSSASGYKRNAFDGQVLI